MRITNRMMAEDALQSIERSYQRLSNLQDQLASGKRITRSSDDPAGTSRALGFKSAQSAIDKYLQNIDGALGWAQMSDSTLSDISNALSRAHEMAVQAANGTLTSEDRVQLSTEAQQLFDQVVASGNAKYENRYIFAGYKTSTQPFTATTDNYTYGGDTGQISWEVGPGATVPVNVPGSQGVAAALDGLKALRTALSSGDVTSLDTILTQLTSAQDAVLQNQGSLGGRMNRLENTQMRLKTTQVTTAQLLSTTEDADATKVITDLSAQENAYKAALTAASRSLPQSLLDYMK